MAKQLSTVTHKEDDVRVVPGPIRSWGTGRKHKLFTMAHAGLGMGYAFPLPDHPRDQRVFVKVTIAVNRGVDRGNWYRHGTYLQREGANKENARGHGFDREQEEVSLSKTLAQWQKERDPHLFKVIVSPDREDIDHKTFVRRLMKDKVERDFGQKVEWVAITHYNTAHSHMHLLIRGVDAHGHELRIDHTYLWNGGLRQRAREVATELLGWRTGEEIKQSLERAVHSHEWTRLDMALEKQREGHVVRIRDEQTWERKRLQTLTDRGFAWQVEENVWEMSTRWNPREFDALRKERRQRAQEHVKEHMQERERELEW
jgi:type IV secretory pathway VirD2 relaxase